MKVVIRVEESARYDSDIKIKLPSGMTEDQLEDHLDRIERSLRMDGHYLDVESVLEGVGCELLETTSGFPDSPADINLEITDYTVVKDDA